MADGWGGLRIVGLSNPTAPRPLGEYHPLGYVTSVAATANHAYLVNRNTLRILDVSNPMAPVLVGTYHTQGTLRDVALSPDGQTAYVVNSDRGLHAVDVTNPAAPRETGFHAIAYSPRAVATTADYACVAAIDNLYILHTSQPQGPVETGGFEVFGGITRIGLSLSRERLYAINDQGLYIADMSDPFRPSLLGFQPVIGEALGLGISEPYAYVAAGDQGGLQIFDVSDPTHPLHAGYFEMHDNQAHDVAVLDGIAIVTSPTAGARFVNVTNPLAPEQVAIDYNAGGKYITVAGRYAYLTGLSGWYDLTILDVSDPGHPFGRSVFYNNYKWFRLAVAGRYAYVVAKSVFDDPQGFQILDISDTRHLTLAGEYLSWVHMWQTTSIMARGPYAYVTTNDGVQVFDVSTPATPTFVTSHATSYSATDVVLTGNYAFVAASRGGVEILRLLQDRTEAAISPAGGNLASNSGDTILTFPGGAFTDTVTLTYRHLLADQDTGPLAGISHTFEVTGIYSDTGNVAHLVPSQRYTIAVRYSDEDAYSVSEDTLALYRWDGVQWIRESSSGVQPAHNTVTAMPDRFGLFAVLGESHRRFLPLVTRSAVPVEADGSRR